MTPTEAAPTPRDQIAAQAAETRASLERAKNMRPRARHKREGMLWGLETALAILDGAPVPPLPW